MDGQPLSRRHFSLRLASMLPLLGASAPRTMAMHGVPDDGISRTEESIHQEPTFAASRQRVYDALTDEKQFAKLTGLPATISRDAGGAFSLFGNQIRGRHVELVAGSHIVQAWRAEDWPHGAYSIASFALMEHGRGTTLVFDHTGFPKGQATHLAAGWKEHYWAALATIPA